MAQRSRIGRFFVRLKKQFIAILIIVLCTCMLLGMMINSYVSFLKDDARRNYLKEIQSQQERERTSQEELYASCNEKIILLPRGMKPPVGIALAVMCDHALHEPIVENIDVLENIVRCRCRFDE